MCGRYANSETIPAQAARFAAAITAGGEQWKPTWNAAPSQRHPVIMQDTASRRLGLMQWGWKPTFMAGRMLVNARGEEALGKKTFETAMHRRRCIVPATAFYEWQEHTGRPSLPHAIALHDRSLFGIAALWESMTDGDVRVGAFVLLTVPANGVVAPIHHRMAAILQPADEARWLNPTTDGPTASALLQPYPGELTTAWPIPMTVNSVRHDGPELIRPTPSR